MARADECEKMTGACDEAQGMLHRVDRDVRNIDQHSQAVHLLDDFLAKGGQAAMAFGVGGRIGPVQRVGVGQRHVARAWAYNSRSTFSEFSIECPPSTPISDAIRPAA